MSALAVRPLDSAHDDGQLGHLVRGYASGSGNDLVRLRKIEGQVRGLEKMIEDDRWRPHIVPQVASATRALQEVAAKLRIDHPQRGVTRAVASSTAAGAVRVDEVAASVRPVVRL